MIHQAKVDLWVKVVFGGVALIEFVVGTALIVAGLITGVTASGPLLPVGLIMLGVGVVMALFLWGAYRTSYEVTPSELVIRFGPFRTTLPVDAITEVTPTRDPTSAPAPSLDRLRINYRQKGGGTGYVLISPKDKEAFLRDLAQVAPGMKATL